MKALRMLVSNCSYCPFIRYAQYDLTNRTICSNEEAIKRSGGNTLMLFASEGVPEWCPLPEATTENLRSFEAEDEVNKLSNAYPLFQKDLAMDSYVIFSYQKDNPTEDYVKLTYGDNCPVTGKEATPTKCTKEATFDGNTGIGRCMFFSHIVVAAVCCKHPDLKESKNETD